MSVSCADDHSALFRRNIRICLLWSSGWYESLRARETTASGVYGFEWTGVFDTLFRNWVISSCPPCWFLFVLFTPPAEVVRDLTTGTCSRMRSRLFDYPANAFSACSLHQNRVSNNWTSYIGWPKKYNIAIQNLLVNNIKLFAGTPWNSACYLIRCFSLC
jgi:hypothetical protein